MMESHIGNDPVIPYTRPPANDGSDHMLVCTGNASGQTEIALHRELMAMVGLRPATTSGCATARHFQLTIIGELQSAWYDMEYLLPMRLRLGYAPRSSRASSEA